MTSTNSKEARIAKLNQAQETRKQECLNQVNQALERLKKQGVTINFASVAKEADVSVSYLYKYSEVKLRIAELRNSQASMPRKPIAEPASNQSNQKIVCRLKERIRQLESQVTELKRRNEALAGQVYRVHELDELAGRQSRRIKDLEDALHRNASAHLQTASSKPASVSVARRAEVSERIRAEVERLGIHLSKTLTSAILKQEKASVLEAIEAYKQYQTENTVLNPDVCLLRAIEGLWVRNQDRRKNSLVDPAGNFEAFYKEAVEAGFLLDVPPNHLPSDQNGQPLVKVNRPSGCFDWTSMPWKEAREEFSKNAFSSHNAVP